MNNDPVLFHNALPFFTPSTLVSMIADLWGIEDGDTANEMLISILSALVGNVGFDDANDLLSELFPVLDLNDWKEVLG